MSDSQESCSSESTSAAGLTEYLTPVSTLESAADRQRQHLPLYLLTCFTSLEAGAFIRPCSVLRVSRHLHYSSLSYARVKSLPAGSDVCAPFTSPSILWKHHFRCFYTSWFVCVCMVGFRLIDCLFLCSILKKNSILFFRLIIILVPGDGWFSHIKAQISQGSENHLRWLICTTAVEDNECNMGVAANPPNPTTTVTQTKTQQHLDDISF